MQTAVNYLHFFIIEVASCPLLKKMKGPFWAVMVLNGWDKLHCLLSSHFFPMKPTDHGSSGYTGTQFSLLKNRLQIGTKKYITRWGNNPVCNLITVEWCCENKGLSAALSCRLASARRPGAQQPNKYHLHVTIDSDIKERGSLFSQGWKTAPIHHRVHCVHLFIKKHANNSCMWWQRLKNSP